MSSTAPQRRTSAGSREAVARTAQRLRAPLRAVPQVRPTLRSSAPSIPFITLVSVLLLGGVVGLLLFNTSLQQASFEATDLQGQADTLTARQQELEAQVDALDDPQHVAAVANRSGMVFAPNCDATVNLDTARVTGTCTPAVAADTLPIAMPAPRGPVTVTEQAPPPVPQDPTPASTADQARSGQHGKHHGKHAGADKTGADKTGADKTGANKAGANKTGANKTGANKTGANKTGANTTQQDTARR